MATQPAFDMGHYSQLLALEDVGASVDEIMDYSETLVSLFIFPQIFMQAWRFQAQHHTDSPTAAQNIQACLVQEDLQFAHPVTSFPVAKKAAKFVSFEQKQEARFTVATRSSCCSYLAPALSVCGSSDEHYMGVRLKLTVFTMQEPPSHIPKFLPVFPDKHT